MTAAAHPRTQQQDDTWWCTRCHGDRYRWRHKTRKNGIVAWWKACVACEAAAWRERYHRQRETSRAVRPHLRDRICMYARRVEELGMSGDAVDAVLPGVTIFGGE